MKKIVVIMILSLLIMGISGAYAAEKAPLGNSHFSFKIDYITFADDLLELYDIDSGLYLGIDGYWEISPSIYLGGEIGYGMTDGNVSGFDTEGTFIPMEVNVKYAIEVTPQFVIALGGGFSYTNGELEVSAVGFSEDEWFFGGQIFTDLNYVSDDWFVGTNLKYQITEKSDDIDINNVRIGAQVGMMF